MSKSKYVLPFGMVVLALGTLTALGQVRQTPQTPVPPRPQNAAPGKTTVKERPAVTKKDKSEKKTRRHSRKRVYLGVYTVPVEDMGSRARRRLKLKNTEGVVVVEVMPDSPAEEAGLRHGDVITHVNGKLIEDEEELSEDLARQGADKPIKLAIIREGEKKELTAELEEVSASDFQRSAYFGQENGNFEDEGGGSERLMIMCIEHLEKRISRLERQLEQMEKHRSGITPARKKGAVD